MYQALCHPIPSSFPSPYTTSVSSLSSSIQLSLGWLVLQFSLPDQLPIPVLTCDFSSHYVFSAPTIYSTQDGMNPFFLFSLGLRTSPLLMLTGTSAWLSLVRRHWHTWSWKAVSTVTRCCCCCCVRSWNIQDVICSIWGGSPVIAVLSMERMLWALWTRKKRVAALIGYHAKQGNMFSHRIWMACQPIVLPQPASLLHWIMSPECKETLRILCHLLA